MNRARTCDAPQRMFADDEPDSLEAELTDLERRLSAFLKHLLSANVRRPNSRHPGFYSRSVAMLGPRCEWLFRVRGWLNTDKQLKEHFTPASVAKEERATR